ncbi:hypothetical protein RI054_07g40450 [Pseudoscourfieldia marina]
MRRRIAIRSASSIRLLLCLCAVNFAIASVRATANTHSDKQREAVEALPEAASTNSADSSVHKLKLGERTAFADIGPLVIQKDGTAKRIANWDTLTDHEKKATLRIVGKRNRERIAELQNQGLDGVEGPNGRVNFVGNDEL